MNICGAEKATPHMSALRTVFLEETKPIHLCETFFKVDDDGRDVVD